MSHADLLCPGCRRADEVRVLAVGWLFRCRRCDWSYGHPQALDRQQAVELLHDVRTVSI